MGSEQKPRSRLSHMVEQETFQSSVLVQRQTTSRPEPMIPLMQPVIDIEMKAAALSVLENEKLVMGESVYKFEEEFAKFCGTSYAVSTGSGTAALHIAMQALEIAPGAEVLTTPFSFIATANAVIHVGAEPVFVDVEDSGFNLNIQKVREKIGPKTRAILPVHLYGHPCEIDEFQEVAKEAGVSLIEDACQAHGAEFDGKKVGSIGDAGCFSFYPAKNMTVGGDGGMITTNSEELAEAAKSIRDCGRDTNNKYSMSRIGQTSRLNSVNAAIGRVQLRRLEGWNQSRRRISMLYRKELDNAEGITLPPPERRIERPVYHLFVIRTKRREEIREYLNRNGVETGIHYPIPIHLQIPYRQKHGYVEGTFPSSEALSREVVSLPMYPSLTDEQVLRVCSLVKQSLTAFN